MQSTQTRERIVVGISGASGAVIGVRLLAALRRLATAETHLIVSPSGAITAAQELGLSRSDLEGLADVVHNVRDIDRGYERIDTRLQALGARIERVAA